MKYYITPTFILFLFLLSCNTNKTNSWEDRTYNLSGEKIALNHFFYSPRGLCIKDSILLINDFNSDTIFYVYNINEKPIKLIYSFGTKGEGPDPAPLRINKNNICFYDRSLYKYQTIDLSNKNVYSERVSPVGFYNIIKISDNGWGIPKEKHERIFESGYRGNSVPGGSGIGLHYTQMVAEAHRGTIRVESSEGKGSVFIIELPQRTMFNNLKRRLCRKR